MSPLPIHPLQALPFKELAKLIPHRPRHRTVRKWHEVGRKNPFTGEIVKLEAIHLPIGMGSSLEAYERFVEALNRKDS